MEAWALIFRNLYTGFLLRDFAGKIVPGFLLIFSVVALFKKPADLYEEAKKEVPVFFILLLAAFAWTVTLGTQSLAEGLGIWSYFPAANVAAAPAGSPAPATKGPGFWKNLISPPPDKTFDKDTLDVDEFQAKASEDEKQQYERFVVIKEACGNLFVAGILAIPAWTFRALRVRNVSIIPRRWTALPEGRVLLCGVYGLLLLLGLHRMHSQHVYRQYKFAQDLAEKHKAMPESKPQTIHLELEQK
jgi:hypothetical protein